MKSYNLSIYRKVLNSHTDPSKGFKIERYPYPWRGVTNFRTALSWLDKNVPDWWDINVYSRPGKEYQGRIYTDTRSWQQFRR